MRNELNKYGTSNEDKWWNNKEVCTKIFSTNYALYQVVSTIPCEDSNQELVILKALNSIKEDKYVWAYRKDLVHTLINDDGYDYCLNPAWVLSSELKTYFDFLHEQYLNTVQSLQDVQSALSHNELDSLVLKRGWFGDARTLADVSLAPLLRCSSGNVFGSYEFEIDMDQSANVFLFSAFSHLSQEEIEQYLSRNDQDVLKTLTICLKQARLLVRFLTTGIERVQKKINQTKNPSYQIVLKAVLEGCVNSIEEVAWVKHLLDFFNAYMHWTDGELQKEAQQNGVSVEYMRNAMFTRFIQGFDDDEEEEEKHHRLAPRKRYSRMDPSMLKTLSQRCSEIVGLLSKKIALLKAPSNFDHTLSDDVFSCVISKFCYNSGVRNNNVNDFYDSLLNPVHYSTNTINKKKALQSSDIMKYNQIEQAYNNIFCNTFTLIKSTASQDTTLTDGTILRVLVDNNSYSNTDETWIQQYLNIFVHPSSDKLTMMNEQFSAHWLQSEQKCPDLIYIRTKLIPKTTKIVQEEYDDENVMKITHYNPNLVATSQIHDEQAVIQDNLLLDEDIPDPVSVQNPSNDDENEDWMDIKVANNNEKQTANPNDVALNWWKSQQTVFSDLGTEEIKFDEPEASNSGINAVKDIKNQIKKHPKNPNPKPTIFSNHSAPPNPDLDDLNVWDLLQDTKEDDND